MNMTGAAEHPCASLNVFGGQNWYAIHVNSRHEFTVAEKLRTAGIDLFLPVIERLRQWQDRKKMVSFPLFPGYLFVKICNTPHEILTVLRTNGVARILGESALNPAVVPSDQIESLKKAIEDKRTLDPYPYLAEGERVRIKRGSMEGLEGILIKREGLHKLVLSIELLRRAVSLNIDASEVESA